MPRLIATNPAASRWRFARLVSPERELWYASRCTNSLVFSALVSSTHRRKYHSEICLCSRCRCDESIRRYTTSPTAEFLIIHCCEAP